MSRSPFLSVVPERDRRTSMHERLLSAYREEGLANRYRPASVKLKLVTIQKFVAFTEKYVWEWTPALINSWAAQKQQLGIAKSTFRMKISVLRDFSRFVADPGYPFAEQIRKEFGVEVRQCVSLRMTVRHGHDGLSNKRRPFSEDEIATITSFLRNLMKEAVELGRKGAISAARDYAMFATQIAWGLRARELCWLEFGDIIASPDAEARELFGEIGALNVRWGKSKKGQEPQTRPVLSVPLFEEYVKVLKWYLAEVRTQMSPALPPEDYERPRDALDERYNVNLLFLNERGMRMEPAYWEKRLKAIIMELGLSEALVSHDCRHYYATRLQEDGLDFAFVQKQLGHQYASTTANYTWISDSFGRDIVRAAAKKQIDKRRIAKLKKP